MRVCNYWRDFIIPVKDRDLLKSIVFIDMTT